MTSASGSPCSSCRSVYPLWLCAPPFCATVSVPGGSGPARAEAGGTERHVQRGTERVPWPCALRRSAPSAPPPLPLYLAPRSPPPRPLPPSVSVASRREPPPPSPSPLPPLSRRLPPPPGSCTGESISRALMRGGEGAHNASSAVTAPQITVWCRLRGPGAMDNSNNETRLH